MLSLPTWFLNENAGFALPDDRFISVFSYYAQDDYFLDSITYHGSAEELAWLRQGYTRVMLHSVGESIRGPISIPATGIEVESGNLHNGGIGGGSRIGGQPSLLQAETLDLRAEQFALQIYGGSFPKPYQDAFGLSDAVGYLYLNPDMTIPAAEQHAGTFFVQAS